MITECYDDVAKTNREIQNAFVYAADATKGAPAGGKAWMLSIPYAMLKSVEVADFNNDGKEDLLIMAITESNGVLRSRIIVKNFADWATLSDKSYVIAENR